VTPLIGRTFTEDEDEIGHDRMAVLTYGLWQRRFGGEPSVVGRSISLNGEPHTVVGVMRPEFAYPTREFQIYTLLTFATGRLLATLLFNVASSDLVSFGSATLVLLLVALAACGLPARRAARVDPSIALRAE
jgi:hypothetical protein